jgi:tagatose 1,6-diphosphate aldolase GatY/KbaY
MSYVNLRGILAHAMKNRYAVGAFNIVDYVTTAAVVRAAESKRSPVVIQTSVKTVKLYGYKPIVNWVRTLAEDATVPVVLHLDHCKDLDVIEKCIEAGWSSVMIDASSFPLEENIRMTRETMKMAGAKDVTVEGELGAIVGVEDDIFVKAEESFLADVESCVKYVEATGIDLLAPAIGTAHGVYHAEPRIDFQLIGEIAEKTRMPLAIHGGTGLSPEVFKKCIETGGTKINISTNIKHLFRDSLEEYFREHPEDYEPVRSIGHLEKRVAEGVEGFMDIFGSTGRA